MIIFTIPKQEKFLRRQAEPVEVAEIVKPSFINFTRELVQAMLTADGRGIAAPQVGVSQRVMVIHNDQSKTVDHLVLINPRVVSLSVKINKDEEGCLSVPGRYGIVSRPSKVRVKALLMSGEAVDIKAKGIYARVLQHEIDHLDGILFIDRTNLIFDAQGKQLTI